MPRKVATYVEPKAVSRRYKRARRGGDDTDSADEARAKMGARWWREPDGKHCAGELWAWIERLRPAWSSRGLFDLILEGIYNDRPLGMGYDSTAAAGRGSWVRGPSANMNIAKMMVDASTARLTKRRPMPVISADDAGWSEKQFAKRASRVLRRKMGGHHVERISPLLIRDFNIRGTACGKSCRWNVGDTRMERHPIFEFIWDEREADYGEPQTLAQIKPINRDVLLETFPKYAEDIEKAPPFSRVNPWIAQTYQGPGWTDHIEVAESWHLPSAPDADDGQHVIAIRNRVIMREPWTRPRYPVSFAYWCPPQRGLRGTSLIEELASLQERINSTMADIDEMIRYQGKLKIFVQRGSQIVKSHLRAKGIAVIEIDGAAPSTQNALPALAEAISYVNMLMQKAEHLSGFNEMALSSKNVLGANASGKAIDTMDDIQSDRFAHVESGWMQFRVEQAQLQIDEARCMYEEAHGKYKKQFDEQPEPIAKDDLAPWIAEIDWRKIDIDGGDYHLTIEPINFLPDSRAGKLSFVAELSKAGLIPDPTMTADLFDEPDIARANRTILGPKHNLDRVMEGLADEDIDYLDVAPDPHMNLPLGVLMAKGELNDAQAMKAPDAVLDRYRNWIEDAKRLLDQANGAPSLQGAQSNTTIAQGNAATLQPGLGGGPPGGMPPPGMDAGGPPPMPMGAAA